MIKHAQTGKRGGQREEAGRFGDALLVASAALDPGVRNLLAHVPVCFVWERYLDSLIVGKRYAVHERRRGCFLGCR